MAQASQLSRYRPAVLAVTGVAAACGIYLLYTSVTYDTHNKTTLARSNAVHRPRASTSWPRVEHTPPSAGAPLGHTTIYRNNLKLHVDLASFPTMDELISALGTVSPTMYDGVATQCMLIALRMYWDIDAPEDPEDLNWSRGLPPTLARRGSAEYHRALSEAFPGVDRHVIEKTVREFLEDVLSNPNNTEVAGTEILDVINSAPVEPSQGIKGLLYYIAEEDARRKAYEHRGIQCDECGELIRGIRWKCINCRSFDLCSTCEMSPAHPKTHVFAKIKVPLPILFQPTESPLWYPGDPLRMHTTFNAGVKKSMALEYGYDESAIDALYDQFTCIAEHTRKADDTQTDVAIGRVAFNKALTSERWPQRFAPDLLYERMFAFYDEDGDGYIGFREFVSGMAYLRGPKRFESLHRALKGFDISGDNYLDRKDFLRLFRAKYVVQQQIVGDWVEEQERDQSLAAVDILRGSQPISSIFNQEEIPQGEDRPARGKQRDPFGDMQPREGEKTILEEKDPWPMPRVDLRISSDNLPERARRRLSRLEDILYASAGTNNTEIFRQNDAEPLSTMAAAARNSFDGTGIDAGDEPFGTEVLWQVLEDGFNDMLDPLFAAIEAEHNEVIKTRDERERWRLDIERASEDKREFERELKAAAEVDPLMAIALNSYSPVRLVRKKSIIDGPDRIQIPLETLAPTDDESLAAREADIARQPLEELLEATGYGIIETTEDSDVSATSDAGSVSDNVTGSPVIADSSEASVEPMLPQTRPNATPGSEPAPPVTAESIPNDNTTVASQCPSRQRLQELASHDEVEKDITKRGGPGRLDLNEITKIVRADKTGELRGLVISWLEWASF